MSDISDISSLVRHLVEDFSLSQIPGDIFTYGSSSVFPLSEPNVISLSAVYVNGTVITSSSYSFNSSTNKLTISSSLTSGDTIEIQYTYYPNYSDTFIENYIRSATVYLSVNNYYTFQLDEATDTFYPDVSAREKNLIALITSILMKPDNMSYRLPDISLIVPKSLPTRDLISKSIAIFKNNTHGLFSVL